MLVANTLTRTFEIKKNGNTIQLADPNINYSPEAVLDFYSNQYPELVTAKIEGPKIMDDTVSFRFVTTLGTKG